MKKFEQLIKDRRSTRSFTDDLLKQEDVEKLLKAALMAPTSKNTTEWSFIIVENKDTLEQLARCKAHGAAMISKAPLAIIVCADPFLNDVWIEDAAIASIYIQLQAEDLGLGSCWVQIRNRETEHGSSSEEYVREVL
ncbi:MAG: nitroreductase family protein, partial [Bacteroidales bacterium]